HVSFAQFARSSCESSQHVMHGLGLLQLSQSVVRLLFGPRPISAIAGFQQLCGIRRRTGREAGLAFLQPEANRDLELLQRVAYFYRARFMSGKTWFVWFGMVIAFVLMWNEVRN